MVRYAGSHYTQVVWTTDGPSFPNLLWYPTYSNYKHITNQTGNYVIFPFFWIYLFKLLHISQKERNSPRQDADQSHTKNGEWIKLIFPQRSLNEKYSKIKIEKKNFILMGWKSWQSFVIIRAHDHLFFERLNLKASYSVTLARSSCANKIPLDLT